MKKQTFKKIFSFIGVFSFMFLFLVNLANAQGYDVCKNLPGTQILVPTGYTVVGGDCVEVSVLNTNNQLNRTSDTYEPLAELPGLTDLNFSQECPLVDYINTIFELLIGIIIIIAMVKLVLGGLEYITSESISGKANAKESIINAFAGLVIALGAYLILNTINPTLLNLCPKIDKVTQTISGDAAGDDIIDPDFAQGKKVYSNNTAASPAMIEAQEKLKDGWSISKIIISQDGTMQLEIRKGSQVELTGKTNTAKGINGYTSNPRPNDKKTPLGDFKIGQIRYSPGEAQFNSKGSNMGAAFWELTGPGVSGRGIGIHGNKTGTLSDTNGCVRLTNADILLLQPYIRSGITVSIR